MNDPACLLLMLEQRSISLEDHMRLFVEITYLTHYPDYCLCTFYKSSLNEECIARLSGDGPRGIFATFVEWVLSQSPAHHHPAAWSISQNPPLMESQSPPRPMSHHQRVQYGAEDRPGARARDVRPGARAGYRARHRGERHGGKLRPLHHGSALALRILSVALAHRLSASGSSTTCSAAVGRPPGVISPSSTMAPRSVGSTMGCHHGCGLGPAWLLLLQVPLVSVLAPPSVRSALAPTVSSLAPPSVITLDSVGRPPPGHPATSWTFSNHLFPSHIQCRS